VTGGDRSGERGVSQDRSSTRADPGGASPEPWDPAELAIVLSHFNLGVISTIEPIVRGVGGASKFRVRSESGEFVLKRRMEGRDLMSRVAFSHCVQVELARRGFPAPALMPTARTRSSIVAHGRRLYELHRWIHGDRFTQKDWEARAAGSCLAWFHDLLSGFDPPQAPTPTLERADRTSRVRASLESIELRGAGAARELAGALDEADRVAAGVGLDAWPTVINHGDWHPGNILFGTTAVAGVLDYDHAKRTQRAHDLATGVLQFGLMRGGKDPQTWPESADEPMMRAFVEGYDATARDPLTRAEAEALPWLMIEGIIGESVGPIATTGRFAAIDGSAFLDMVARKVGWLRRHAGRLSGMVEAR
jgi:Ser/Thr protein kinase RdoA (MazF antagonist)